jgi:SAM-dependent methyltransferase
MPQHDNLISDGYVTDVAYLPSYYPAMAPAQMQYVASLNGIAPPKTQRQFSYLELGCGFGSTVLALAAANPNGQFTAIDFMPVHTDHIAVEANASDLHNLHIHCADFATLPDDIGGFDFITLHGVFSWVSPELRRCILDIIRRHLNPGGLVEVTYNCMPGWASLLPVRTLLRYFSDKVTGNSAQRVTAALQEVQNLRKADVPLFHDQPLAAQLVDKLLNADPHYVAHEYLNEHWTAFDFANVQKMFADINLHYAGRLPVHHNHWQLCAQQQFASQFSNSGEVETETLKDHHANIMFRWDIYSIEPRRQWTATQRAEATPDLYFRVDPTSGKLPHTVQYGAVEAGINGPPHDKLLEFMGTAGWRLSELLNCHELASFSPEIIVEAIDTGVALKLFQVEGGAVEALAETPSHVEAGTLQVPLLFNQRALRRENFSNEQVGLASPRTHAGQAIGDLHALILTELISKGSDAIELRVADKLIAADKHLREHRTNRPITERAEMIHAAREICGDFITRVLPELMRLGVVTILRP